MVNVTCLKWGTKYPPDYVNRLHRMVKRHLARGYGFFCVTDNPQGLERGIEVIPLPDIQLVGWWNKLWLFSEDFPLRGSSLFLDLDLVILRNLEPILDFDDEKLFVSIADYVREEEFNTSVFRWQPGASELIRVWQDFLSFTADLEQSPRAAMQKHFNFLRKRFALKRRKRISSMSELTLLGGYTGDQRWLSEQIWHQPWTSTLPAGWCCSYKWGAGKAAGRLERRQVGELPQNCRVVVFEGRHKPHECLHLPLVRDNWG